MSTADILATERLDSPEKLDEGSAIQHLENYNDNVHGSGDNQANDEPNDLFVASHDQPPADAVSDHCPAEESDAPEEAADPEVKKEVNSPKHVMVSDHDEQKGTAKPKKPIGRRPKNAREQAVKRHEKEREEFKDHVRKEMQKKGLDVSPDDIELPQPKRRRARKGVADLGNEEMDGPDGGLTHIQSEAEAVVVSKKRRHEEISQSANAAITVFGFHKVQCVQKDGESGLYRLAGMKALLKEWQLVAVAWMVKRETHIIPPLGGVLADVPGMGKTVVSLAAVVGNPPTKEEMDESQAATLIVLPNATVLKQWEEQIFAHVKLDKGAQKPYIYRKSNQLNNVNLGRLHLVLTTYAELQRSYPSRKTIAQLEQECTREADDGSGNKILDRPAFEAKRNEHIGVLFRVKWYRVILDEVHQIRNYDTQTCIATRHLQAKHFWGLSGTPLINGAMELFPYLKIIGYTEAETQEEYEEKYLRSDEEKEAIDTLVYLITFRRTQDDLFLGRKMLNLPLSYPGDQWVNLSAEERVIYDLTSTWFANRPHTEQKTMLLRQRQAVSHPYLLENFFRAVLEPGYLRECIKELSKVEGQTPVYLQIGNWADRHRLSESDEPSQGVAAVPPHLQPFGKSSFGHKFKMARLLTLALSEAILSEATCGICETEGIEKPVATKKCKHIFCQKCVQKELDKLALSGPWAMKCPTCGEAWSETVDMGTLDTLKERTAEAAMVANKRRAKQKNSPMKKQKMAVREQRRRSTRPSDSETRRPGEDFLGVKPSFGELDGEFFIKAVHSSEYGGLGVPTPGAKVTAVKDTVLRWQEEDPDDKGIIFTQFIMTSQIIGQMLRLEGIEFVYLNGRMTTNQKIKAVKAFHENKDVKYMVASMRCGGQALNLTCANRVIMVDIWWNKAAEAQAFGRVFRLGQVKETHYVRILARNTVDDRIRELQDRKDEEITRVLQDDGHVLAERSEWAILHRLYRARYLEILTECMNEIRDEVAKGKNRKDPVPEKEMDDE